MRPYIIISVLAVLVFGGVFAIRKGGLLESYNPIAGNGEAAMVQRDYVPLLAWGERKTSKTQVSHDILVVDSGIVEIANTDFLQIGDIVVSGTGKLIFRDSVVRMSREDKQTARIFVREEGELIFENSTLKSALNDPAGLYVNLFDDSRFVFNNSKGIHMLIAKDRSTIEMNDSVWAFSLPEFRGGGIKVSDASATYIKSSKIGGLTISIPDIARLNIKDFMPGRFSKWDLRENFNASNLPFNVILEDSEILADYLEDPNERGLSIVVGEKSEGLDVSSSELNRLVVISNNTKNDYEGLELGRASDFFHNNIRLSNSSVMGQWGFFIYGGSAKFSDSQGLLVSPSGDGTLEVTSSEINEFIPRAYTGVAEFSDVIWKNSGSIVSSDFILKGSTFLQGFSDITLSPLIWRASKVSREFDLTVISFDPKPTAVRHGVVEVFDKDDNLVIKTVTDKTGNVNFTIEFHDNNFQDNFYIRVKGDGKEIKHNINFFTSTPIKLILK